MADGVGGALVDSVAECAQAITELLQQPERATTLAQVGRERVRAQFLTPRLLLNEIALMNTLVEKRPITRAAAPAAPYRDPVCGMVVSDATPFTATYAERLYRFCSGDCHARFLDSPEHFLLTPAPRAQAHI
jgi:trehalose synthase